MRRVFVVLVLLGMMAGLDALKVQSEGDGHPLTLAAIGFVLLAAFAMAELGARLSLPKVSGYVLSGVALGPFVGDILSASMVEELEMFRWLALGLIATTAGLELDWSGLVARGRTLGSTIGLKIVLGSLCVGAAIVALGTQTRLLGELSVESVWILAFIFSALSLGTSPAVAVAVTSETSAAGRLTSLVLDAAVLKDLLVATCLAMALAGGDVLLGGGSLGGRVLMGVIEQLGISIAAGAMLGILLIVFVRFVRAQMLLFVGAMVLVIVEIGAALNLGVLLVFITAGAVVRNFSSYADALRRPLRTFSFPVFIVFFTTIGAGLDLDAVQTMLPAAIIVCCARAAAYAAAGRLGAVIGGETDAVRRLVWLGYLPQAEVTLGFVIVAASGVPQLATTVVTLGTAVVAVNLILGPITLSMAVERADETPRGRQPDPGAASDASAPTTGMDVLESPRLRGLASEIESEIDRTWQVWLDERLRPAAQQWARLLHCESTGQHIAAEVMNRLDRIAPPDGREQIDDFRRLLAMQLRGLDMLPMSQSVPLERRHARPQPGDAPAVRISKWSRSILATVTGRARRRTRNVPVRLLARTSLEPRLVRVAEETLRDWHRFEVVTLEAVQRGVIGTASAAEVNRNLDALTRDFLDKVRANIGAAMGAGMRQLVAWLASADAPGVSSGDFRYSRVEADIEASLERMEEDALAWRDCRISAVATLRFIAFVEHAQHELVEDIVRDVAAPLDEAFAVVERSVVAQRQRIDSLAAMPEARSGDDAWERLGMQARAVLPKPVLRENRLADNRVRRATSTSAPMTGLLAYMDALDRRARIVPSLHEVATAARPATVSPVWVDIREVGETRIAQELLPNLERALAEVAEAFTAIRQTMKEAAHLVEQGFDAATHARASGEPDAFGELRVAVERASALLDALQERSCSAWRRKRGEVLESVARLSHRMFEAVVAAAGGSRSYRAAAPSRWEPMRRRLRRFADAVVGAFRRWIRGLHIEEASRAAEDLAHLYRVRTGIERLDAQAIRELVAGQQRLYRTEAPADYAALFGVEALRDPRLFLVNREVPAALANAERDWQSDPAQGNAVLIVGHSGSGKSSTLGIARLKVGSRRVIVVRPAAEGDASLFVALARSLGLADGTEGTLSHTLQQQRSVIVVDDLHHWFEPTTRGVAQLERFLRLIAETQLGTFWICAMSSEAFEAWDGVVPLCHAFVSIPRLQPVSTEELGEVVLTRHSLSGSTLSFPATPGARLARRLLRRPMQATFVRHLAAASNGNLRRALRLWVAHARAAGDGMSLRPVHTFGWGLPFVRQLAPKVKAALALLVRHGALDESILSKNLGVGVDETRQIVRFVVASGLVECVPTCHRYAIRPPIFDDLVDALAEDGVFGGGGM